MTAYIHVEPGYAQRPGFAAWGLAQDPPLQTASASGWDVPIELYPVIPAELLEGAYADGYLVGTTGTPAAAPQATEPPKGAASETNFGDGGEGQVDVNAVQGNRLSALDAIIPPTSTRRSRAGASTRKPKTDPATIVLAEGVTK